MNTSVILPSLDPDEKLIPVINGLKDAGFTDIIVVNDGSSPTCLAPFEAASAIDGVTVLAHEVNKGKGRAMKTAFQWFLENRPAMAGVVTVDGDGQHLPKDVKAVSEAMEKEPDKLWLGVRDFSLPQVPKKSRFGNTMTRTILRIACGVHVSDTQTGLRAISTALLPQMLEMEGERYEYETQQLMDAQRQGIPFGEVVIDTVYIDENQTSHYRPLRDSLRILKMVAKFVASSLITTLLDLIVFALLNLLLAKHIPDSVRLLLATYVARVISCAANYIVNRHLVFKEQKSPAGSAIRYTILAILQAAASYGLLLLISTLLDASPTAQSFLKMAVDVALFFVSYQFQLRWVFRDPGKKGTA